jgi:hypothetical protein
VAACSGNAVTAPDAAPPDADTNVAPLAPTIMTPEVGRIDITSANLKVAVSAFSDPDGNGQGALEAEIWFVSPGGTPTSAMWTARVAAGAQVAAADGAFSLGTTGFDQWTDYAVRARYWDGAPVPKASEWSEFRTFRTDDGSTELFAAATIRDVYLTIPQDSYDRINAEAALPGCVHGDRQYYGGAFEAEGQTYPGVGIHVKGGCGSARALSSKASLKVALGWDDPAVAGCPSDRRWHGQKTLTFNASVQDGTLAHERVGYHFLSTLGVAVPRISPVRMHVNGEYWGLYNQLESVDRRFLERRFESSKGMLYEGAYWCEIDSTNLPVGDVDDRCLRREFKTDACSSSGNEPTTYDALRDLVSRLDALPADGFYPAINDFFDYETFLSQWAAHAIMGDWDAYVYGIRNNYRVYRDSATLKWHMIPTGIDQTFGADLSAWGVAGRLATSCLAQPMCQTHFVEKLNAALVTFEALQLDTKAQQIYDQIKNDVYADPRKEVSNQDFTIRNDEFREWLRMRPAQVRADIVARGF